MLLLAVGDVVDPLLYPEFDRRRWPALTVAAVVSCGDLPPDYLTFLAERFQAPLFYVRGNHDGSYAYTPPEGCTSIDGRVLRWRGLRLLGVGGVPLHNGGSEQYSERAMDFRLVRQWFAIRRLGGLDIVVSHAPPRMPTPGHSTRAAVSNKGVATDPGSGWADPGHRGFWAFGRLIQRSAPRLWLHGHTHIAYGTAARERRLGTTRVTNVYGHCLIEVDGDSTMAKE
jgi:uncharacterized protein